MPEVVTSDQARQARLETVAGWVDTLLLPPGQTVADAEPGFVFGRIKAASMCKRPVLGAAARGAWHARRSIVVAVQTALQIRY